jgi:hypothetical protein
MDFDMVQGPRKSTNMVLGQGRARGGYFVSDLTSPRWNEGQISNFYLQQNKRSRNDWETRDLPYGTVPRSRRAEIRGGKSGSALLHVCNRASYACRDSLLRPACSSARASPSCDSGHTGANGSEPR